MHLIYHSIVGIGGSVFFGPSFFIGSILPDTALVRNELRLRKSGKKFDSYTVYRVDFHLYHFTHSLWFPIMIGLFFPACAIGILTHQAMDWFSHSGPFSTRPLFPFMEISIEEMLRKCIKKQ